LASAGMRREDWLMQGRYKSKVREVLGAMLAGMSPKEAALTHGTARGYGNKVAVRAGLQPRYLTDAEWREILTMRGRLTAPIGATGLRTHKLT